MDSFDRILKLSEKIDGKLSKVAMEAPEALGALDEILNYWIDEDIKEITAMNERLTGEYWAAQQALQKGELVEMNEAVSAQTYAHIQGNLQLLKYVPLFKARIKDMRDSLARSQLDGMPLLEYLRGEASSLLAEANMISDKLKKVKIFMNPRELKSWRKLSVMIRDHMTDMGEPLDRHVFRSRLREPGSFNKEQSPSTNQKVAPAVPDNSETTQHTDVTAPAKKKPA